MSKASSLGWAFLIAGIVGLLGEALFEIFRSLMVTVPEEIAIVLTLLAMGVIGCALVLTRTYQRIENRAQFGVMGTFVGFVPGAANMFMQLKCEEGTGKAFGKTIGVLCLMILAGCALAFVAAAVFAAVR